MVWKFLSASVARKVRRQVVAATGPAFDAMRGQLGIVDALMAQQWLDATRQAVAPRNPLAACGFKVYSQNDEDGIIEELCRRTLGDRPGCFLELGVGDGTENNTLNLLLKGWTGAWLGAEDIVVPADDRALAYRKCWIDRDNVAELARQALAPLGGAAPDLVSVDLDGNDYHVNEALLKAGLRPSVWIAEYNARFGGRTRWVMPYNARHEWDKTDYYGASLASLDDLFKSHGYRMVACNLNGVNAFFVEGRHAAAFAEVPDDPARLFMPAYFRAYPQWGHRMSLEVVKAALAARTAAAQPRDPGPR